MNFPKFVAPDFSKEPFVSAPDVKTEPAGDGYLPENFYASTIYPEYFKINGKWTMLHKSRMDCCVVKHSPLTVYFKVFGVNKR